jgi:lipopolysaccharide transport system ATP-binding protein
MRELGATDDVVAKYLSASLMKEQRREREQRTGRQQTDTIEATGDAEAAAPPVIEFRSSPGGHRYGDGRAVILGGDILDPSDRSLRAAAPGDHVVLRFTFRTHGEIAEPIVGFLVRNQRGEVIFGSNTAREDYPIAPMSAGEMNTVDFHWAVPALTDPMYRVSIAVADGQIEEFRMCDYIEDAIEFGVSGPRDPGSDGRGGYFQLRCAAVEIHSI